MKRIVALICVVALASLASFAGTAKASGPCAGSGIVGHWSYQGLDGSHIYEYYGVICGNTDYIQTGVNYIGEYD